MRQIHIVNAKYIVLGNQSATRYSSIIGNVKQLAMGCLIYMAGTINLRYSATRKLTYAPHALAWKYQRKYQEYTTCTCMV